MIVLALLSVVVWLVDNLCRRQAVEEAQQIAKRRQEQLEEKRRKQILREKQREEARVQARIEAERLKQEQVCPYTDQAPPTASISLRCTGGAKEAC